MSPNPWIYSTGDIFRKWEKNNNTPGQKVERLLGKVPMKLISSLLIFLVGVLNLELTIPVFASQVADFGPNGKDKIHTSRSLGLFVFRQPLLLTNPQKVDVTATDIPCNPSTAASFSAASIRYFHCTKGGYV